MILAALHLVAAAVQAAGVVLESPSHAPRTRARGRRIYLAGLGVQQTLVILVAMFAALFHYTIRRHGRQHQQQQRFEGFATATGTTAPHLVTWKGAGGHRLLLAVYVVLGCLTVRACFSQYPISTSFRITLPHFPFIYLPFRSNALPPHSLHLAISHRHMACFPIYWPDSHVLTPPLFVI